jgi:hypothetical protein
VRVCQYGHDDVVIWAKANGAPELPDDSDDSNDSDESG